MLEPNNPTVPTDPASSGSDAAPTTAAPAPRKATRPRKAAARKTAPDAGTAAPDGADAALEPPKKASRPRKTTAKKAAPVAAVDPGSNEPGHPVPDSGPADEPVVATVEQPAKTARKRAPKKAAASTEAAARTAAETAVAPELARPELPATDPAPTTDADARTAERPARRRGGRAAATTGSTSPTGSDAQPADPVLAAPGVLFVAPSEAAPTTTRRRRAAKAPAGPPVAQGAEAPADDVAEPTFDIVDDVVAEEVEDPEEVRETAAEEATGARRRRRRGRRGRGGRTRDGAEDETDESVTAEAGDADEAEAEAEAEADETEEVGESGAGSSARRRRRRRRRTGDGGDEQAEGDDPPNTVVHVRDSGNGRAKGSADGDSDDGVRGVRGSTRLEAKRQRRRDGRDSGRRRPPILTESEFLARREAVDRVMAVRDLGDRTQIAVLEDDVLVEHYVTRASSTSYVGNIYLGRVQNVLPSMEAAFVDIGKGRNGVLYAGEVNWDAAGLEGKARAIENALNSGDTVLVQVTKDPIGHKGARLTSQISLPGRYLVYVPGGGMTGISRKLPDTERHRLKTILKQIVPEDAGVIIRTAAEGASEQDLTHDVERLKAQWESIQTKAAQPKAAPTLVYGEPDLAIRVVRDVFNEDFQKLLVQGEGAWQTVSGYVDDVAPDLAERVRRHTAEGDLFHDLRVDEQLTKALDRKVFLPSGGSLVIDRTEAMTVIDVNTGKFIGSGGNLEQTVTRNNLEAAEEIVRQLRLRDVGGIVVIDFIDMVLESNRELVLRRLTECLGRDRTKHQVAEVTSLGLVQMTRKRVGEGLLEAFSEQCPTCNGRGVIVHAEPVDQSRSADESASASSDERPAAKRKSKRGKTEAPAESPLNEEQRKAAAFAMAAIAGATLNGHEHDGERGSEADDDTRHAVSVQVEAVVDLMRDPAEAAASEPGPEPEPADERADEQSAVADPEVPVRRGRRRAATRPAGPPVAAMS